MRDDPAALAFFSEPHDLLGDAPRRPRSLMTQAALELLGITVHQPDHKLDLEDEGRQIACYDYLHAARIKDVKMLVATLDWRRMFAAPVSDETIGTFRFVRDRYHALIEAAEYRIRLKEDEKKSIDEQPGDIKLPSMMAIRIGRIAEETGWPYQWIGWHLPFPVALQLLHRSQAAAGRWTIGPAAPDSATPDDLTPSWMRRPGDIDTAAA